MTAALLVGLNLKKTQKKRVFLDLIDSDLTGECRCPRKLSTDEKNYLGLCIALWQTRLQYTKHVIEYIERDSQKKKYLSKKRIRGVKVTTENLECGENNDDNKKPCPSTLGSVILKTELSESSKKDYDGEIPRTVAFNPYMKRKKAPTTGIANKNCEKRG
jgi:hypothetical protein